MSGASTFASRLLAWFDDHGRHDLPWQHPRTPYRVWLSEVMLQQTQVSVVAPYFRRFVSALPDIRSLATASTDTVHALWSGLGYYARARHLHAAAKICVEHHDGELPRDFEALLALPGIGRSTAGAILAQAWGERFPILDGNVKRLLSRHHGVDGWPGAPAVQAVLWTHATAHLPGERLADYTQAQMDLGASVCTRQAPACLMCPVETSCVASATGRTGELPQPRPRKALPQRNTFLLLAMDNEARVLLERRPPSGIWSGLWSLPQADDDASAKRWFNRHLRGRYRTGETLPPIAHAFTHYRLQLQPRRWRHVVPAPRISDDVNVRWFSTAQLDAVGLPTPIRKLLKDQ